MEGVKTLKSRLIGLQAGSRIALLACMLWVFCLPFSMAQQIRFTSIFLFSILGAFLIKVLTEGFDPWRVPFRIVRLIFPLGLFAILPLIHFFPAGSNTRELLLNAPLFLIPYILFYLSRDWPKWQTKAMVFSLAFSFVLLTGFLLMQGPNTVWFSVRSETELPDIFLLARPQMGFLAGVLFFMCRQQFLFLQKPVLSTISFGLTVLLLFWILSKIALLSFISAVLLCWVIASKSKPLLFVSQITIISIVILFLIWKLMGSGLVTEALSRDGLSFEKYPKAYVNSINSRVVLWRSSFDLVSSPENLFSGISSDKLLQELDFAVGKYNPYLKTRHLNPHNQFLYLLLMYGVLGVICWFCFWSSILKAIQKYPNLISMWFFMYLCSITEIFLDREFGTQVYLLMVFLSVRVLPDTVPASPAENG